MIKNDVVFPWGPRYFQVPLAHPGHHETKAPTPSKITEALPATNILPF